MTLLIEITFCFRLLKSGMTLTQIYGQYVNISEELMLKEVENKRLNNYIDQILQVLFNNVSYPQEILISIR